MLGLEELLSHPAFNTPDAVNSVWSTYGQPILDHRQGLRDARMAAEMEQANTLENMAAQAQYDAQAQEASDASALESALITSGLENGTIGAETLAGLGVDPMLASSFTAQQGGLDEEDKAVLGPLVMAASRGISPLNAAYDKDAAPETWAVEALGRGESPALRMERVLDEVGTYALAAGIDPAVAKAYAQEVYGGLAPAPPAAPGAPAPQQGPTRGSNASALETLGLPEGTTLEEAKRILGMIGDFPGAANGPAGLFGLLS